jgi:hypothetical protein
MSTAVSTLSERANELGMSAQYQRLVAAMPEADELITFHPQIVPGLLQLPGYAKHMIERQPIVETRSAARIEDIAYLRATVGREVRSNRRQDRAIYVGAAALKKNVGSQQDMSDQLAYMINLTKEGEHVRVIPDDRLHGAMSGPMTTVYSAAKGGFVYAEHFGGAALMTDEDTWRHAMATTDEWHLQALSRDESIALMEEAAVDLSSTPPRQQ